MEGNYRKRSVVRELQGPFCGRNYRNPSLVRELQEPFCSKGTTGNFPWKGATGTVL